MRRFRDGPLENFSGGEGNFRAAGVFFRYQIPGMNFFLGHSMNIFLGLTGVQEFFHLIFPCANFFLYFARPSPPPPHQFSSGPSLKNLVSKDVRARLYKA